MQIQRNGRAVFAATGGKPFDPALPALVFVHGASFDRTVWNLQARYFAYHGHGVLALDLPGHGRSEGPLIDNIEGLADWLVETVAAAGVDRFGLVGHSMGAMIGIAAAARHPGAVERLALLGPAVPMPVADALLKPAQANEHIAKERLTVWGFGRNAELGGHKVPGLWMVGGGLRILERTADDVLYTDLAACDAYKDTGALGAIRCPSLVVMGESDIMTPLKAGRAVADGIADCRTAIIPGAGHIMLIEKPDETLDALRDFFAA